FDNDKKILKVDSNETLSLNQFFRDVGNNKNIPINRLGIYYGKVKVETFGDGNTGLKVIFCESKSIPKLYTNKKLMLEKFYGKHAKTHINTDKELFVFFRGFLNEENKWQAYNDDFYKDLYFSLTGL